MESSSEEIRPGTIVADTYEVTRLLGQGGMGQVWEAQHRRLPGKRVAVKVLLGQAAADPNSYARFRREAEIASRLGHPNIVEALDFNTLPGGTPYIILEFLRGESLAKRISAGPMSVDAALAIARQVASALAAAHKEGVVHRDLKPDNIFLCPTEAGGVVAEHVKVLDFGISKIRDSKTVQTQASALIGTPQYMSPEQASGKHAETDHRTDQFALGAIVFEMLMGEAVFGGHTLAEVITKVLFEEAPLDRLAGRAPDHVIAAVGRALKKSAAERFSDIGAFTAALTGRPLQTLERQAALSPREMMPFQPTVDAVDPLGGTMAPSATGNRAAEAFAATSASQPMPVVKPLSNPSLAAGEVLPSVMPPPISTNPPEAAAAASAAGPAPGAAKKSSLPMILGAGGALLGVGALLFVVLHKPPATPEKTVAGPVAVVANPAPAPSPTPSPGPSASPTPSPGPSAGPTPSPGPSASPTPSPGPGPGPSPGPTAANPPNPAPGPKKPAPAAAPKALPPAAEELLGKAERALAAGQGHDAVRDGQKSLELADSLRARSVIARGGCVDHSSDKAYIHKNHITKQSAGEWAKIRAFCKKYQVELP